MATLRRRTAENPQLSTLVAPYIDLLAVQAPMEAIFSPPSLPDTEVRARLERGLPALVPEDFRAEPQILRRLWEEICAVVARHFPETLSGLESIRRWLESQEDGLLTAASFYLRGETDLIAQEAGLEESLFQFVLNHTLRPFLRRYSAALGSQVNLETWYRPYCPICGGEPDFAALVKPYGARHLLCSRCDFEWPYRRLSCPFCGNDDPAQYLYSLSEDGVYRLYLCDRCRRYLKAIDLRELSEEPPLPAERILTIPMDMAALQEGYGPAQRRG